MERIDKLKEMLAQNPADSFLQHVLALEYVKAGNEGEARAVFEQLLARNEKYVGSYYHLAKLLVLKGETDRAVACYEKGMQVAKSVGDTHAYNELQAAYEDLVY